MQVHWPVLCPHEVVAYAHKLGEKAFASAFLGEAGVDGIKRYWDERTGARYIYIYIARVIWNMLSSNQQHICVETQKSRP